MEAIIASELIIVLLLVLANGVFAGAELSLLTLRKTRLRELLDEGSQAARLIAALRANPERLLATVQIGITVISSTAAAFMSLIPVRSVACIPLTTSCL